MIRPVTCAEARVELPWEVMVVQRDAIKDGNRWPVEQLIRSAVATNGR
jgi:hypothetical protein